MATEYNGGHVPWTMEVHLLANIANTAVLNLWSKTKDGEKNRNRPKAIEPQGKLYETRKNKLQSYEISELKSILSKKRTDIKPNQIQINKDNNTDLLRI